MARDLLFEVTSVLGKRIRVTYTYWEKIVRDKHPRMKGKELAVQESLNKADQVRRSKSDPHVFLYYKKSGKRYVCVVARHLDGEGFVITTYLADNIKEGEIVWTKLR